MNIKNLFSNLFNVLTGPSTDTKSNIETWKHQILSDGILRSHSFVTQFSLPATLRNLYLGDNTQVNRVEEGSTGIGSVLDTAINLGSSLFGFTPGITKTTTQDISLRTMGVSAPGISFLNSDNIKRYGLGPVYNVPYNVVQTDIVCSHIVDSQGHLYGFFQDWMNTIVKYDNPNNILNNTSYDVGYFDDYVTTLWVYLYDEGGDVVKKIALYETYPTAVDPIALNWGTNDDFSILNVTYKFVSFSIGE